VRQLLYVPLAAFLLACGGLGAATIPDPTPPTQALGAWTTFPADRNPRPILMLDTPPVYPGFSSGGGKIAAYCGKFKLAFEPTTTAPKLASATWPDGTAATFAAISAADAYAAMVSSPPQITSIDCASAQPLEVSAARLGSSRFRTDRGTAPMSAWLFTVTGSIGDVAYPAIAPSAFWNRKTAMVSFNEGGSVSRDGLTVNYGFTGGECDAGYKSAVAESTSAVAVVVVAIPKGGAYQACSAVGILRTITITLASPLGGRVLIDGSGAVESVCPETMRAGC
jgi:hypothetical protein